MTTGSTGWRRMWGPHLDQSDRAVRNQALLWSSVTLVWVVVLVLTLALQRPINPLLLAAYVISLAAAALNAVVWVHAGRLRRAASGTARPPTAVPT